MLKVLTSYLEKQKSFIPKKNIFLAIVNIKTKKAMFTDSIFQEGFDFYHAPEQLSIPLNKLPCVWRLYRVRQFLDIRVRCHWLLNLCPDRRPQGPRRPGVRYHIYDNMNSLPSPALNRWLMRNPWKDLEKKRDNGINSHSMRVWITILVGDHTWWHF